MSLIALCFTSGACPAQVTQAHGSREPARDTAVPWYDLWLIPSSPQSQNPDSLLLELESIRLQSCSLTNFLGTAALQTLPQPLKGTTVVPARDEQPDVKASQKPSERLDIRCRLWVYRNLPTMGDIVTVFVGLPLAVFLGYRQIKFWMKNLAWNKSVLILGPQNVGKTYLTNFLTGKPLTRRSHQHETMEENIGKIVCDLTGFQMCVFRSCHVDIGGEFPDRWDDLLRQDPIGIIYMVDHKIDDTIVPDKLKKEIEGLEHIRVTYEKLRKAKQGREFRLKSFLLLVNKSDEWGATPKQRQQVMDYYTKQLLPIAVDYFGPRFPSRSRRVYCSCDYCSIQDCGCTPRLIEVLRRFVTEVDYEGDPDV